MHQRPGHRSGLTFYSKPFIGCFFYNDGRGVGDDNSNEGVEISNGL